MKPLREMIKAFKVTPLYCTLHSHLGETEDWLGIEARLWGQYNLAVPTLKFGQMEFKWSDLYDSDMTTGDFCYWFEVWQNYQKAVCSTGPKSRGSLKDQKAVHNPWPWMAGIPVKNRQK